MQLRDSWLQSLIQSIPQTDTYHHISKTIEEYRIHLFDIITQYRAIFADDSDSVSTSLLSSDKFNIGSLLGNHQKDFNESKLFYYWLQQKIRNFLFILRKDLTAGVGNRLDSVVSQAMYFGLAFSRVGLDFRALMVPIFEEVALEQFKKALATANVKFEEALLKLNWSELYLESSKSLNASLQQSMDYASDSKNKQNSGGIVNPPIQILEFQPLAVYLNCILQHFNELRLCAPLNLYAKVFAETRASIKKLGAFVEAYHKKEKLDKNESELFSSFLYHFNYLLVPYLEKCLCILFPVEQLQKVYSIPQTELDKFKQNLKLNASELLQNLAELIPPMKLPEAVTVSTIVEVPEEKIAAEIQEEEKAPEETPKMQDQVAPVVEESTAESTDLKEEAAVDQEKESEKDELS